MKENKTRLAETNNMRDLMGLELIEEQKEKVIGTGIVGNYDDDENKEEEDIAGAPEEESGLEDFDKDIEDKSNIKKEKVQTEDSEGEETYHYGEDEGEDREEEEHLEDEEKMAPEDRVREIERHLDALKKDMGFDEDREDRDEEGTDFREQRTFKIKKDGKILSLTEGDIKKILSKSKKRI